MQRSVPPRDSSTANGSGRAAAWPAVEEFLRTRGAAGMPSHPGGTLLEHLLRVADRLGAWGADPTVQLAGLCHAAYGTDGFDQCLVRPTDRAVLSALIGERAEALVHLYATCDRGAVYPRLGCARSVVFRDRYGQRAHPVGAGRPCLPRNHRRQRTRRAGPQCRPRRSPRSGPATAVHPLARPALRRGLGCLRSTVGPVRPRTGARDPDNGLGPPGAHGRRPGPHRRTSTNASLV